MSCRCMSNCRNDPGKMSCGYVTRLTHELLIHELLGMLPSVPMANKQIRTLMTNVLMSILMSTLICNRMVNMRVLIMLLIAAGAYIARK